MTVKSGVPQGTVLNPLLFLLYINDIEKNFASLIRLFADDSALYRHIKSESDAILLQEDLSKLHFVCSNFSSNYNLKRHVENIHKRKKFRKAK